MDQLRSQACVLRGAGRACSPLRVMSGHRRILQLCGAWGTARSRSLDTFDPTDWRLNPEGCQKVAGGRLGQGERPPEGHAQRSRTPERVPELPLFERNKPYVESISGWCGNGDSGTPSGVRDRFAA